MISQMNEEQNIEVKQSCSDFSIDHILNRAGSSVTCNSENFENCNEVPPVSFPIGPFPWLHCSRYCPPRIPRTQKREVPQKRQLGRHPRIPFTSHQLSVLEEKFKHSPYLSSEEVSALSRKLDLADIRVKIWFQNRRARERRERPYLVKESSSQSPPTTSRTSPQLQDAVHEPSSNLQRDSSQILYANVLHPSIIVQNDMRQYFNQISNLLPLDPHLPERDTT